MVSDEAVSQISEHYRLVAMGAHSETGVLPVARVVMSIDGKECQADAQGGGPVDATFKAIEQIANSGTELQLYSVNNITSGTDAQGEVTCAAVQRRAHRQWTGLRIPTSWWHPPRPISTR